MDEDRVIYERRVIGCAKEIHFGKRRVLIHQLCRKHGVENLAPLDISG